MKLLNVGMNLARGTNINTVEIPAELRVKHPTGLPWVDDLLGGGFTPSVSGFITGDPSCGKSTMVRTIADALTRQGHQVLYNCGEESPYQVKMACERLGLDAGFVIGEDIFVTDVVAHAKELQKKCKKGKKVFVFVDSLQCLDDGRFDTGKTNKATPVNCGKALIEWAKETFGIAIWVHQVTKAGVFVGDNTLKHAVDMTIHFGFDRDKKSETYGERVLKKTKDRFGPASDAMVMEMGLGGRLGVKVIEDSETSEDDDSDDLQEAAE